MNQQRELRVEAGTLWRPQTGTLAILITAVPLWFWHQISSKGHLWEVAGGFLLLSCPEVTLHFGVTSQEDTGQPWGEQPASLAPRWRVPPKLVCGRVGSGSCCLHTGGNWLHDQAPRDMVASLNRGRFPGPIWTEPGRGGPAPHRSNDNLDNSMDFLASEGGSVRGQAWKTLWESCVLLLHFSFLVEIYYTHHSSISICYEKFLALRRRQLFWNIQKFYHQESQNHIGWMYSGTSEIIHSKPKTLQMKKWIKRQ